MRPLSVFFVCLENAIMMACWTALAIHFEKWWIALFAILCFTTWKHRTNNSQNGKTE